MGEGQKMAEKEVKAKEAAKTPKAKKEKKKGKLGEAWRGFKSEFKKIVWPSWKQVRKNTLVVVVIVAVFAVIIGALDIALSRGMGALTDFFTHTH